jgi:anti-sigma B factor antagonist
MEILTSAQGNVSVIEVKGRVDTTTAPQLGEALNEQIGAGHRFLVLDLVNVDYMSSAGLRELVNAYKKASRLAGDLRLVQPSERVQEILEIAGLDSVFRVFPSQADAISSF